ncbi:LOW QUALITY PROTEIN: protein mono-ADP-ribosyltransferase PARP12-like [Penaeus monodon]|uniref:LOW QUALITY PROTEIN: protein mono-ADP-ribosyltransferase PARP12-like n=1 Tax=Penaeus monodon TaxID=6687 RepID=UPI0018A6F391|nr:LOW QUALITY PROTEIN: protein mono-ADP-ribosyltransferase PARP12-like [Penaeus monodon]
MSNDAGQVCRDRNTNHNSCRPGGQLKHAHKKQYLDEYDLVEILAQKEDLTSSIIGVIKERNVDIKDLQRILDNNANIFPIKNDRFCFNHKLKLCTGHLGSKGCEKKRDCIDLHICRNFLDEICRYKSCDLGHNLATGHNTKVLRNFFLDRLESDTLLRVLSKTLPKSTSNSHKGNADQETRDDEFLETSESDANPPSGNDDESDADRLSGDRVERKKRSPNKTKTQIQSVWSSDSNGDVGIPEICYDSVEGKCARQDIDCERLHSFQHFYWQISKENNKWFNLHPQLVFCLEKSYCDASKDGAILPRLKEADLQSSHTDAMKILSRDEWTSDFQSMTLVNSTHTVNVHLRRLCSQNTARTSVKANTFRWFFRADNQKWVPYDNIDDSEEQGLHITDISEDIEKHYLVKSNQCFTIKKQKFAYVLDFQKMSQLNVITNKTREIRRRPLEHLQDTSDRSFLPEDWEDMQPKERMRLVDLDPNSNEYEDVITLLKDDTYKAKVQKIQRNQNPYLWKTFQIKKEEMITQYGDEASVKMTDLFHGTKHDIVSNICKENFDFRLHGENTGHIWGKGSYFGNNITYCYRYCRPDQAGLRYLFVAKVLIGTITRGDKELKRPPMNTATGSLFDTTVDDEAQPTIFVKYDKQEYYPYYVITMS